MEFSSSKEIVDRLNRMAEQINTFNIGKERPYYLTFTAGICRVDNPNLEIIQLQDRANLARKSLQKRDDSRLCVCAFYKEMERAHLLAQKDIENRMRSALRNREFQVYLQPKLCLSTKKVGGAEALARWLDPARGMIMPNDFIPVFEENGFITQLDLYIMSETCRLMRKWLDAGLQPPPVSVNVSRIHFTSPNFVEDYVNVCREYNVPPELIELEITETVVFEDPALFNELVQKLHAQGFCCSMDDFGSGYSSLNLLKDMEVDTLKLDRAFFSSPEMDNFKGRSVVASVIDLAKQLKLHTVAEGVETPAQQTFLESVNCDLLQGYVFSKPIPVADYEQLAFGSTIPDADAPQPTDQSNK